MQTLLQIGAGNIGRACVGRLFHDAGYHVCFSDVNKDLLALMDEKKSYSVRMVGQDFDKTLVIDNVSILPTDQSQKEELYKNVDVITTAVGVPILPRIAPLIVEIINYRHQNNISSPLNIVACENAVRATSTLKKHVMDALDSSVVAWCEGVVAFPDAATDSIVPTVISDDPLLVTSENFAELIIEKSAFIGDLPAVEGLYLKDNLDAYIERKLFTLNTGRAVTAYHGYLKGYETIKQSIADSEVKDSVQKTMIESGDVLINRYGFSKDEHHAYIKKIIGRFENPYLNDEVARVGRDPLRKLSRNDRLIKPILGAVEYKLPYEYLLKGVKAALQFKNDQDESCIKMHELLAQPDGLQQITGLSESVPEENAILQQI